MCCVRVANRHPVLFCDTYTTGSTRRDYVRIRRFHYYVRIPTHFFGFGTLHEHLLYLQVLTPTIATFANGRMIARNAYGTRLPAHSNASLGRQNPATVGTKTFSRYHSDSHKQYLFIQYSLLSMRK